MPQLKTKSVISDLRTSKSLIQFLSESEYFKSYQKLSLELRWFFSPNPKHLKFLFNTMCICENLISCSNSFSPNTFVESKCTSYINKHYFIDKIVACDLLGGKRNCGDKRRAQFKILTERNTSQQQS